MATEGETPETPENNENPDIRVQRENRDASESTTARRSWQGQRAAEDTKVRTSQRRTKIIVISAMLSALAAMGIVLIRFIDLPSPPPYFLTINVAEHNYKHFPLQAFARADSEILLRHFDEGKKKEATTRSKELLLNELDGLKSRGGDSLIIHLTAPALVRGDVVYLLPADAEPDNEATWLSVEHVLQAVEQCPSKNKLLILDLAHGLVDPRLGVHADRVAESLEKYLRSLDLSFFVLCPCSAWQSSLTSEVLRSSVLAYYLDQGLLGGADTDTNGTITVLELLDFVKPRVDRWARNNRGVRQEPRLFGKSADFVIVPLGKTPLEKSALSVPESYPEAFQAAWKKHDAAWDLGAFDAVPRKFLQLEANLLRDESRWRGGLSSKEVLDQETRNLLDEIPKLLAPPADTMRPLSVVNVKDDLTASKAIVNVFRRATDGKKAMGEISQILEKVKNPEYPRQVRIVADALSLIPELKQMHLIAARKALADLGGKETFIEVIYLERLAAFSDREFPETFQMASCEILWRAMRQRELSYAAAARAPELLPWVSASLEKADKNRRIAEGMLLWERPPVWPEAIRNLKSSGEAYDLVTKTVEGMQTGSASLNRALADLPIYLRVLGTGPEADPYAEQVWFKAAEKAATLQKYFAAPPDAAGPDTARVDTVGRELRQALDELSKLLRFRVKSVENFETPAAQRKVRRLLQSPRLKAAERADLTKKLRESAKKLNEGTDKSDQPAPQAEDLKSGQVLAEMSLALLVLAGIESKDPDLRLPALKDPLKFPLREKKLHALWGTDGIVKQLREALPDRRGHALSCLVSAWDPGARGDDLSRRWQTRLREEHTEWLRAQIDRESREAGPRMRKMDETRDQAIRDFYRDALQ